MREILLKNDCLLTLGNQWIFGKSGRKYVKELRKVIIWGKRMLNTCAFYGHYRSKF
jgi:hypothetical protein